MDVHLKGFCDRQPRSDNSVWRGGGHRTKQLLGGASRNIAWWQALRTLKNSKVKTFFVNFLDQEVAKVATFKIVV